MEREFENFAQEKYAGILKEQNLDIVIETDDYPVDVLEAFEGQVERIPKPFDREVDWENPSPFCFDFDDPLEEGEFDPHSLFLYTNNIEEVAKWLKENYDYEKPKEAIELRDRLSDMRKENPENMKEKVENAILAFLDIRGKDKINLYDVNYRFLDFVDGDNSEAFEPQKADDPEASGWQIPSQAVYRLLEKAGEDALPDKGFDTSLDAAISSLSEWITLHKKEFAGKLYEAREIKKGFAEAYGGEEAAAWQGVRYIDRPDYPSRFEDDEKKMNIFYVMHENMARKLEPSGSEGARKALDDIVENDMAVLDGDVVAYRIVDLESGETLKSCGGFIGYEQSEDAILESIGNDLDEIMAERKANAPIPG